MWYYKEKQFNPEENDYQNYAGFVYLITDKENNKKYVGKKLFWRTIKRPPLKGKKRKRIETVDSDWQDYYGSSEQVKTLVESSGGGRFHREILRLCKTKGEMTYYEMKEQIDREVLFSDEYYNEFIGGKIHSKHIR